MDTFLRNANELLETAWEAKSSGVAEFLIAVTEGGSIRMLSETAGWALPALAAEYGATAVYRVSRENKLVRVEGWSATRHCVLSRDLPKSYSLLPGAVLGGTNLWCGLGKPEACPA